MKDDAPEYVTEAEDCSSEQDLYSDPEEEVTTLYVFKPSERAQ